MSFLLNLPSRKKDSFAFMTVFESSPHQAHLPTGYFALNDTSPPKGQSIGICESRTPLGMDVAQPQNRTSEKRGQKRQAAASAMEALGDLTAVGGVALGNSLGCPQPMQVQLAGGDMKSTPTRCNNSSSFGERESLGTELEIERVEANGRRAKAPRVAL